MTDTDRPWPRPDAPWPARHVQEPPPPPLLVRLERIRERLALAVVEVEGEIRDLEARHENLGKEIVGARLRRDRFSMLADLDLPVLGQVIAALKLEDADQYRTHLEELGDVL